MLERPEETKAEAKMKRQEAPEQEDDHMIEESIVSQLQWVSGGDDEV